MPIASWHPAALPRARDASMRVGDAYSNAGDNYLAYADGDAQQIYAFDSRYGYGDRQVWMLLDQKMKALRASGSDSIQILDAGCGPGTWIRRVVVRARALGFRRINARGFDIAEAQIQRAQRLSTNLRGLAGVDVHFEIADITRPFPEADLSVDISLCLYAVLNHVTAKNLSPVVREIARVTSGCFVTTVRAAGSPPTIFVEGIEHARRFHQDHRSELIDVELDDGRCMTFCSRLFTSSELRRVVSPHLDVEYLRGLDLFHGRFAPDPRWNPDWMADDDRFQNELARLEEVYGSDPNFIDYAAHLLLVARGRGANRRGN